MRSEELQLMAALEGSHWWYRGLRDLLARLLQAPRFRLRPSPAVLDAGCGSGANLRLLAELLSPEYLGGFDLDPAAAAISADMCPAADVYRGDLCAPEVRALELDLVLSCDAITAPGIQRAEGGFRRMAEHLRPRGLMILHVPACPWLYSEHDLAVANCQRLTLSDMAGLFRRLGLEIELLSHRVCLLFPWIVALRLGRLRRAGGTADAATSDLRHHPAWLNAALLRTLEVENQALARGATLPYGSSIIAVGRKP